MNHKDLNIIKSMMDLGVGDRIGYYEDDNHIHIIKIKKFEKYGKFCNILFDGSCYYLIKGKNILSKGKNKDDVIPEGVAKEL